MILNFQPKMARRTILLLSTIILSAVASLTSAQTPWQGAVVYSGSNQVSSGVPVSNCHVLSNEHAVRGRNMVTIAIEGKKYSATVVAKDLNNDLSLLKLSSCNIQHYAQLSKVSPTKGERVTSVYYKPGGLINKIISSTGNFLGYSNIITEEEKNMLSMVIDDSSPKKGASGGGVMTSHGLVSVIFGITGGRNKTTAYAVDYYAVRDFLHFNKIQS